MGSCVCLYAMPGPHVPPSLQASQLQSTTGGRLKSCGCCRSSLRSTLPSCAWLQVWAACMSTASGGCTHRPIVLPSGEALQAVVRQLLSSLPAADLGLPTSVLVQAAGASAGLSSREQAAHAQLLHLLLRTPTEAAVAAPPSMASSQQDKAEPGCSDGQQGLGQAADLCALWGVGPVDPVARCFAALQPAELVRVLYYMAEQQPRAVAALLIPPGAVGCTRPACDSHQEKTFGARPPLGCVPVCSQAQRLR